MVPPPARPTFSLDEQPPQFSFCSSRLFPFARRLFLPILGGYGTLRPLCSPSFLLLARLLSIDLTHNVLSPLLVPLLSKIRRPVSAPVFFGGPIETSPLAKILLPLGVFSFRTILFDVAGPRFFTTRDFFVPWSVCLCPPQAPRPPFGRGRLNDVSLGHSRDA